VIQNRRPASTADEVRLYDRLREVFTGGTARCFLSQAAEACYGLIEKGESCPLAFVVADYFKSLDRAAQERFFSLLVDAKSGHYHELAIGNAHERVVLLHLHLVLAEIALHKGPAASELDMTAYHLARAEVPDRPGGSRPVRCATSCRRASALRCATRRTWAATRRATTPT
jgi:hypothetical protein